MKISAPFKIGIAMGICLVLGAVLPVVADPGSSSDPLVSKSYIEDTLMPQIKTLISDEVAKRDSKTGTSFTVVSLKAGQKLMCDAGCELILRMGNATVIATEKGGLADTTGGYDLANGSAMPSNHLLIVPVSDGRGITALNDVLVMAKGYYEIK